MAYYRRKFNAKEYWANKPLCSICQKKKVKNGTICHDCQKEGDWPTKYVRSEHLNNLEENDLLQVFNSTEILRSEASETTKSVSGYLKDCALATLRAYNLTDISNTKDVSTLPLTNISYSEISENVPLSSKKAFEIAYKFAAKQKELDLLLGVVFIAGTIKKKDKKVKILSPLLFLNLEALRSKDEVIFSVSDDVVELNHSLLAKLVPSSQEDEIDIRLQDIYQNLPSWPFNHDDLQNFISLLSNAFPDSFEYKKDDFEDYTPIDDFDISATPKIYYSNSIVLAPKREAEGTVVNELLQLSENLLNQTAIDTLFETEESIISNQKTGLNEVSGEENEWTDLNPLDLSDEKQKILQAVRENKLTVITGPPGTGKSFTILGIILDHLLAGKRVLFVSKMDKAVDVVVSNLEKKIGVFSVARSGNRKAQRSLADKISKVTGPNSPVKKTTQKQIDDIKEKYHLIERGIENYKSDFESILNQERSWGGFQEKIEELDQDLGDFSINNDLHIDIDQAEKLKNTAKKSHEWSDPTNFFLKTWWGKKRISSLKNKLNLPADASLEQVISSIEKIKLKTSQKEIETEIVDFENANEIWNKISSLKNEAHKQAQDLINSILLGNLYVILSNHEKRLQLRNLRTALLSANIQKKQELLSKVDPETLVTAFPFWASTTNHLSQILPLEPGMFDLVIFDEASQCDLASSLPALYRANRAVIVGDPQQLKHVVFMSKQIEQAAMINNNLKSEDRLLYRYSERSLFDVAEDRVEQGSNFILDEHFRSDPRIISFSSDHFYEGSLRIMTNHPVKQVSQNAIEVRYVNGRRLKNSAENPTEVEAIFSELKRIIKDSSKQSIKPTIGVLCPFRDQVDAITKELPKHISLEDMDKHEIVIGTAHSLQGDEKNIILLSLSIDPNYHHGTLRFLEQPNVFNVSITRAKDKLIVFSSVKNTDLPHGILNDFLTYAEKTIDEKISDDLYDSKFEKEVATALRNMGYKVWPQFKVAGFKIDLVVGNNDNFIAVECDGPTHFDVEERAPYHDSWRQGILERAGWQFVRISHREWENDKKEALMRVAKELN